MQIVAEPSLATAPGKRDGGLCLPLTERTENHEYANGIRTDDKNGISVVPNRGAAALLAGDAGVRGRFHAYPHHGAGRRGGVVHYGPGTQRLVHYMDSDISYGGNRGLRPAASRSPLVVHENAKIR